MRSRGATFSMSDGARRGLTLTWLLLFVLSVLLQYGTLANPAPVLGASGLKAATVQGFEVDGDLASGNGASNPGTVPAALIDGTLTNGDDWLDGASFTGVVDPATPPSSTIVHDLVSSTSDDGFGGGAKETDTRTWSYDLHKATPKDDVEYAMAYAKFVGNSAYFYAGATRIVNNGDTHIDFELNRKPFRTYSDGISKPDRSIGDVLISLEFSNGGSDPIVTVYKVTAVTEYPTGQDTTYSADVATAAAVHSATNFAALADQGLGAIPEFEFAETSIDLAALGINTGCPGLSNGHIRTRSGGDLDSSQLKDNIQPFPIDLNNCGKVVIVKDAQPNAAQDFSFSSTLAGATSFSLDDDNDATLSNQKTVFDVVPGQYTATEATTAGWALTGLTCDDANSTGSVGTRTATINVEANETVTCTFVNQPLGKIVVVKQTLPDGASQSFEFDPSWSGANFHLTDGQASDSGPLAPGTYSVAEVNLPAEWHLTSATCDDGSAVGSIGLSYGETVTCTFTNTQDGHIITVKETTPDGANDDFEFVPSWSGSHFLLSDGEQHDSGPLTPGSGYSVTEIEPDGWDLSSVSCSDGSPNTNINLAPGETVTCTFNNRADGKIVVVKQTNPDGDPASFEFDSSYGPNFFLSDGQQNDSGFLDPGTYSVAELAKAGWDLTSATCSDGSPISAISLQPGEVVTCTFTNTKRGHIVVDKVTNPSGDPQSFSFTTTGSGYSGFSLTDAAVPNDQEVLPGKYSVAETPVSGWDLTSAVCDSGETIADLDVLPGETVHCTFTNTKRGHIVVDKVTAPAGDPQSFQFTTTGAGYNGFSLTDAAAPNSQEVLPGKYSVAETAVAGWDLTSAVCDSGETIADLDVNPGETVTCTFTNTKRGHIVVDKVTNPSGDPQSFSFTTTGSGYSGFSLTDAAVPNDQEVLPGSYSVSESPVAGWDLTSATCDQGETPASLDVEPGETVTCTFTNTKRGTIVVEKVTSPAGAADSFTFTGDAAGSIKDGGSIVVGNLVPGTYTSTESDPGEDWDLGSIVCDDANSDGDVASATATFELDPGETVTCTFTNVKRGTITIIKDARPNSGQDFAFTGDLGAFSLDDDGDAGNGTSNLASFENQLAGDYSVTETDAAGWVLTDVSCETTGGSSAEVDGATVNLTLTVGGSITCVFENSMPDIEIVKTAGDAADGEVYVVEAGPDNVTYHYAVTNTGYVDLFDVTVVDDAGTPGVPGDDIDVCTIDALPVGATETCDVTLTILEPTENVAVASGHTDTTPDESVSDDDNALVRVPGVGITKTNDDADGVVGHGQVVTYTIDVTVIDGPVTDAVVTDTLPAGQTYVPGSQLSSPTADAFAVSADGRTLTWSWSSLQSAAHITYQVTIDGDAAVGAQTNEAEICVAELAECKPSDSTVAVPDLVIDKSYTGNTGGSVGDTGLAKITDTLTYTLTYDLTGGPVHDGVITDTLPEGLTYVDGSATNNDEFTFVAYDDATRTLTWTAPVVSKDGSVSYQVTVDDDAFELPQPLVNVATIDSDETDQDDADEDVGVQEVEEATATPVVTLPPTDAVDGSSGPTGGPGFGLQLALLTIAGIGILAANLAARPTRRVPVRRR